MIGLDWIAAILGIIGCFLVGSGYRFGWILYCIASCINIYIGYTNSLLGVSVGAFFYFILELRGWYKHNKVR